MNKIEEVDVERIKVLKQDYDTITKRIDKLKINIFGIQLSFIVGFCFFYTLFSVSYLASIISNQSIILIITSGLVSGVGMYIYTIFFIKYILESKKRKIEFDLINEGADTLREYLKEDFLTKLVNKEFRYLDQYYIMTKEQINKGFIIFILMTISSIFALVSIAATGIVLLLFRKPDPAYLTTVVGVISEFISLLFFFLYNETFLKLSDYHNKFILSQNISLALRIADDLVKNKSADSGQILTNRLIADIQIYFKGMTEETRPYAELRRDFHHSRSYKSLIH